MFLAAFQLPISRMDQGTLLVYLRAGLKGKLPYRDFETFYGPPNPFLLAVVYHIGGIGLTPERATGFAYRLIFLGACFVLPGAGTPPSLPGARFLPRSFW